MQFDRNTFKSMNSAIDQAVYKEFRPTRQCLQDIKEVRVRLQKQERKRVKNNERKAN